MVWLDLAESDSGSAMWSWVVGHAVGTQDLGTMPIACLEGDRPDANPK